MSLFMESENIQDKIISSRLVSKFN